MTITLATLPDATAQQVFDHVARHLLTQGRKSQTHAYAAPVCLYHGPDGLMCAAGCLMSDAEYQPGFEDRRWQSLARDEHVPSAHQELVMFLQKVHDAYAPERWFTALETLASNRRLNTRALAKFNP